MPQPRPVSGLVIAESLMHEGFNHLTSIRPGEMWMAQDPRQPNPTVHYLPHDLFPRNPLQPRATTRSLETLQFLKRAVEAELGEPDTQVTYVRDVFRAAALEGTSRPAPLISMLGAASFFVKR